MPPKKPVAPANKTPQKKASATSPTAKKMSAAKKPAASSTKSPPGKGTATPAKEPVKEPVEDMAVTIKLGELSNEVMGGDARFKKSGRWPFVLDATGASATFLQYRDVNMIDALNLANLSPDIVRRAVLGGLRYGKPVVLNMGDADLFDACVLKFDTVQKGLMDDILSKEIMKNEKYLSLVRDDDGPEYESGRFLSEVDKFTFIIASKIGPTASLQKRVFVVEIN